MKKRILFVDDERSVLDGLRRSLRRYRDRWDVAFAEGGDAALAELENYKYDIVVSDMRMPGMDGFTLLSHVRDKYPNTLRLILSGQTEHDVAMKSIAVSHQFLAKPCEGEQLREVLERACTVLDLCTSEDLRGVISRLGTLPSAPGLYQELTAAMAEDEASAAEIGVIIEQDMAMSSKILQIVNSAYLGLPREVSKVADAVSFLGINTIRSLALAEGAFKSLKANAGFGSMDLAREQARGMLTATLARNICLDKKVAERAFLAGMLHDIGVLILATQFPDKFTDFKAACAPGEDGQEQEVEAFGTTHAKIGAFLLGSWGLPLQVTEAVAFHHEPASVGHETFDVLTAVHVASALVGELLPTHTLPTSVGTLDLDYLEGLGLLENLPDWRFQATVLVMKTEEQNDAA